MFQVWLKDGQKATDVEFFKDKPLSAMAQVSVLINFFSFVTDAAT
jgi:hypothetical protein